MSSPEQQQLVGRALSAYLSASDEDAQAAWELLRGTLRAPEDSLIIAESARAAHQALRQAIEAHQELIAALESGPNSLLPVLAVIDEHHFVVSHGNGVYQRVGVVPRDDGAPPPLCAAEFAERGPALAALDSSGSVIVDVYWLDEHEDLFRLVLGGDEGRVVGKDDEVDSAAPDAERVTVAVETGGH